jgi:hypothetical protein
METTSKASCPNSRPRLCQKRPRSNPEKPTPSPQGWLLYGDPVLEWRRPGGTVTA